MPSALRPLPRRSVLAAVLAHCLLARLESAAVRADDRGIVAAATEEVVSTRAIRIPGAGATEIISRLTVPPGAQWTTPLPDGSLLLLIENGKLHVTLVDGRARIVRIFDPLLSRLALPELGPGQEVVLDAGDRLVARGDGAIVALNESVMSAVASVTSVTSRPT